MARERGRPKDKDNRVKVNIVIKPDVRDKIDAQINKGDPLKSSRGKVVEGKF
jgi:hypothetical protein